MRNNKHHRLLQYGGVAGLIVAMGPAFGQEPAALSTPAASTVAPDTGSLARQIEAQRRQLEDARRALDKAEAELLRQRQVLNQARDHLRAMENRIEGGKAPSVAANVPAEKPPTTVGQAPKHTESAPKKAVSALLQAPSVLTPRHSLVLEPSLQFSYSSSYQVNLVGYTIIPAITIGLIDIQSVNQNTLTAALTGRYGVTNRLELFAKLPFLYRQQTTETRPLATPSTAASSFGATGSDVGDIEFGARYQFNSPPPGRPYYIGALTVKTRTGTDPFSVPYRSIYPELPTELPTGSGFYSVQPSLTVIYPRDPVVFFGGVNYSWNIKRNVGNGYGTIDPGDAFGFNFGMGMALNARTGLSVGYEHTLIRPTKQDGVALPGSLTTELGQLLIGYSYQASDKTNYNLTLGAGLTRYTPDVQLTLRVPTTVY